MITFKTFKTKEEVKEACNIAAKYRLAVPGYTFFDMFRNNGKGKPHIYGPYDIRKVTIAYDDGKPIGVTVSYYSWGSLNIGAFVRKSYRKQGLGTQLVVAHKDKEAPKPHVWHHGIRGSHNFWNKQVDKNERVVIA